MNKSLWIFSVGLACMTSIAQQPAAPAPTPAGSGPTSPKPQTQTQKYSYIHGANYGKDFRRKEIEADPEALLQGFKDALQGDDKVWFNEVEMNDIYKVTQTEYRARSEAKRKVAGEKAAKEGAVFLSENIKKPGVKTTPSGLQYKIITDGTGSMPKTNDTVKVHYEGRFIDGKEFDSSIKRGKPAEFPVNGVIKGWTEALTMMKQGSKWQLYIPGALAYGERGSGDKIVPNSTLIFDVELISITPQPPAPPSIATSQPVTSDIVKVPSAEELKRGAKVEVLTPEQVEKEKAKQLQQQKK